MHRSIRSTLRRLRALAVTAGLAAAALGAHAQAGAVYRCAANDFTNVLSEEQAASRHCVRIGSTEWLFTGRDGSGRQYTYNDRRTSYRPDGTVETWVQVVLPIPAGGSTESAFVRTVSPHVLNCRERTITAGPTYRLDVRDNSVRKDFDPRDAPFPPPDAVAKALIGQLCVERSGAAVATRDDDVRRSAKTAVALRTF